MASSKKAGVQFFAKIDTNKDLIGKPNGFKIQYINDSTGVATDVAASFIEIEKVITAASTTTSAACAIGDAIIPVASSTGIVVGDVVEVGGVHYYVTNVTGNDLSVQGGVTAVISSEAAVAKSGKTGAYRCPVTISAVGDYTVIVNNPSEQMQNVVFPVVIEEATIDDVKALIAALQADVTSVKGQVDVLNEASLNGIEAQVTNLASHVATIEALLDGDDNASLNVLKQLITDISGSGIGAIATFVDNVELMLEGKAYTNTDGVLVDADASKGLLEIFNAIVANGNSIATAQSAIATLTTNVATLDGKVTAAQTAIEAAIADSKTSVEAAIAGVKTVVDANKGLLENGTFGLAALKTFMETMDASNTTNFDELDTAVAAAVTTINGVIAAQTTHLDGRFDILEDAIAGLAGTTAYKGFV